MYKPDFPEVYRRNRDMMLHYFEKVQMPDSIRDKVCDLLDNTDFYEAPASTKYHGACPGGLFDHSAEMGLRLKEWSDMGLVSFDHLWSPVLIGMLHDFCKVSKYKCLNPEALIGEYKYDYAEKMASFGGHGADSLCKVLLKVPLTKQEALCIRWHLGPYEKDMWDEYDRAVKECPAVLWTHHADMYVSKIIGV